MIKTAALIILLTARLFYQPAEEKDIVAPFTSPAAFTIPARISALHATLRNDKVVLEWTVDSNESADMFEVEKSSDGKDFKTAALVFGTDIPATASYSFFEKARSSKEKYRIKIVNKDKTAEYSPVVEVTKI